MKLRRTTCTGLFALGALGVIMLDPQFTSGQPGGGGREFKFGGGQPGGGGREFKFGGGQPGGGGPPGGGKFGGGPPGGGMQPGGGGKNPFTDPDTVFNFYSKGSDVIDFSRMDPNMKAFAMRGFEKAGLPAPTDTTVISKAQFTESFTRALAAKGITPGGSPTPQPGSNFGGPPGGGPPGGQSMAFRTEGGDRNRGFGGPPGGNYGGPPGGGYGGNYGYGNKEGAGSGSLEREKMGGPTNFRMTDQDIERKFAETDVNRDGKLSDDEVSDRSPLKASFKESDLNRDGYIDMTEYKAYIAARFGEGSEAGSYGSYAGGNYGRENRDPRGDRPQEQPVIAIRYGKLPTGLPSWWDTLDGDKDGQIGLYEWRQDGRDIKEFQKMDLDSDGVLAPQEWIRFNVQSAEQAKAIAAEEEIGSGSTKSSSGRPSYGSSGSSGNKGYGSPGSGGKDKGSEKGSERPSEKDGKNPFRMGGKK
jgi:hypothetical protein